MNILLRVFCVVFFLFGGLFLLAVMISYIANSEKALEWRSTWAMWFAQGLVFLFLSYVAAWIEKVELRLLANLTTDETPN